MIRMKEITYNTRYVDPTKQPLQDGDTVILHSSPDQMGKIDRVVGDTAMVVWLGSPNKQPVPVKTIRLDKYNLKVREGYYGLSLLFKPGVKVRMHSDEYIPRKDMFTPEPAFEGTVEDVYGERVRVKWPNGRIEDIDKIRLDIVK